MTSIYEPPVQTGSESKNNATVVAHTPASRAKNSLYLAAGWMADKRLTKTREVHTKDLVCSLLSHGARAWRMSQPTANIHLRSVSPFGHPSIHLRVK